MLISERLEMVGPCWLLKLSQMGTQRVQMKGVFPLVGLLGSSCRYKRLLSCLGCPGFFPHRTLFQFICPHRPAIWTGSRGGPPVFEYVPPAHPVQRGCGMAKWDASAGWKSFVQISLRLQIRGCGHPDSVERVPRSSSCQFCPWVFCYRFPFRSVYSTHSGPE
jgi:hypothetical protein